MKQIKKVLIIANDKKPATTPILHHLQIELRARNVEYKTVSPYVFKPKKLNDDYQLIFAIGGDGTFLVTARLFYDTNIPIVGINAGHLGFLMDISPDEMNQHLDAILSNQIEFIKRMMLEIEVHRDDEIVAKFQALNEAVISRAQVVSRMIEIELYVMNDLLSSYRADGVIISTSTGSTAYNLSAGGPILMPGIEAFIITPICPHTLGVRPIVVSWEKELIFKNHPSSVGCTLTVDGQKHFQLSPSDRVLIKKSSHYIKMYYYGDSRFFVTLRRKLGWNI